MYQGLRGHVELLRFSPVGVAIRDLDPADVGLLDALAQLSVDAAAVHAPQWLPTLADAHEELRDASAQGHTTRVLYEDGTPRGWGSVFPVYGSVWEFHPLLVDVAYHRRGFGSRLVHDLEGHAAVAGAGVLFVSTSDETGATSLSGTDLYADPIGALARFEVSESPAAAFWVRMGFSLVGLLPDAEGRGKPSIHLAKRPKPQPPNI